MNEGRIENEDQRLVALEEEAKNKGRYSFKDWETNIFRPRIVKELEDVAKEMSENERAEFWESDSTNEAQFGSIKDYEEYVQNE